LKVAAFDLDSADANTVFFAFGLSCTLSMSDTERQHASNKTYNAASGGGVMFHQLVAWGWFNVSFLGAGSFDT